MGRKKKPKYYKESKCCGATLLKRGHAEKAGCTLVSEIYCPKCGAVAIQRVTSIEKPEMNYEWKDKDVLSVIPKEI